VFGCADLCVGGIGECVCVLCVRCVTVYLSIHQNFSEH
jgi:hypothetical protein